MSSYQILPKLPVPDLCDSLRRFLTAMKPLTTQSHLSQLIHATNSFSKEEGKYLQNKLIQFSQQTDNWASRVWVDTRYLSNRDSLIFTNGKTLPRSRLRWSNHREMLLSVSQHIFRLVKVLETIRDERMPQEMLGNVPQSMSQYRGLVGGYRLPRPHTDTQVFSPDSRHIVVLHAGRIHRMPVYRSAGVDTCMSVEEMYQLLSEVVLSDVSEEEREETGGEVPVSVLTALDRDSWYSAREQLIADSPVNAYSLREIESSLFGLCIDECIDEDENETPKLFRFGDIRNNFRCFNRWYGLGLHSVFTKNGYISVITDHVLIDGYIPQFFDTLPDSQPQFDITTPLDSGLKVDLMKWKISPKVSLLLKDATSKVNQWYRDVDVYNIDFNYFGKDLIKNHGVYYQGFLQLAIQLAYYRLHNHLTSSYQTVSLKRYREGRLEHPITVSEEILTFVQSMATHGVSDRDRWKLMQRAIDTYKRLLSDTSSGHVFVKHIQALRYLAERENLSVDLFQNSDFKLFMQPKLAVSCIFSPIRFLGTMPLRNGHFIGFTATDEYIYICIATTPSCCSVSASTLSKQIQASLLEMKSILVSQSHNVCKRSHL